MKVKIAESKGLGRALALMDFLSLYPQGISLADITRETGLPKSTIHRLLKELIDAEYAYHSKRGLYSLSFKVCELSYRVISGLDIIEASTSVIKRLCNKVGETVHLVVPSGVDIVYLRKEEPVDDTIRTMSYIGMRRPMYCTAAGKSILSACSDEQVLDIWKKSKIVKITNNTINQYQVLLADLEKTRVRGYSIDNEENETGVRCIGSVIRNYLETPVGAISITAPANRITEEKIIELSQHVIEAANSISFCMGYSNKKVNV